MQIAPPKSGDPSNIFRYHLSEFNTHVGIWENHWIQMPDHSVFVPLAFSRNSAPVIDISWVDYPDTASTCDVMYCRQRRHLYYGGENLKNYLTPSPKFSLHRRAALTTNSNGIQPAEKRGMGRGAV
jgi:hypothetical protein